MWLWIAVHKHLSIIVHNIQCKYIIMYIYIYVCEINCHTCISIRTLILFIISGKLPTFKSNPFQCHEFHYKRNLRPQIHMDHIYCFIYWLLHIFADLVALVFMMLQNSCFLGCFMLFPPLPRPHLIPPMAAGCLGCGPQWPPKTSCPGWHPRRHSHQET